MAWFMNRTVFAVVLVGGLLAAGCGSSSTSAAATSTTIDPADLPWVEEFRLDDIGGDDIVFSADSSQLFMNGHSSRVRAAPGGPRFWDLNTKTRTELRIGVVTRDLIAVSSGGSVAFVVDPDDQEIAETTSERADPVIRLWDPLTDKKIRDFSQNTVGDFKFSPDGKLLVAASQTDADVSEIILWDVETGEKVRTFRRDTDGFGGIVFTPDGERILSGSADGTVRIWDVATGRQLGVLDHTQNETGPGTSAISHDGKFLVTDNDVADEAWLWDLETETLVKKLKSTVDMFNIYTLDFSPDGSQVAAGGLGVSVLWDVETGEVIQEFPLSDFEGDVNVAFSPDGERLAISDVAAENSGVGQYTVIFKRNPK